MRGEELGKKVREVWIAWAKEQGACKPCKDNVVIIKGAGADPIWDVVDLMSYHVWKGERNLLKYQLI